MLAWHSWSLINIISNKRNLDLCRTLLEQDPVVLLFECELWQFVWGCLRVSCCRNKDRITQATAGWLQSGNLMEPTSQRTEQLMTGLWTNSWHSVTVASAPPLYPSVGFCCFSDFLSVSCVNRDIPAQVQQQQQLLDLSSVTQMSHGGI